MQNLGNSSYDSSFESRSSGEIEKDVIAELNAFLKQEQKADGLTSESRTEAAHVKGAVTNQTGGNLILEKGEAKEPQTRAEPRKWAQIQLREEGDLPKITMGRRAQGQGESPKLDKPKLVSQNNPHESLINQKVEDSLIFQMDDDTQLIQENAEKDIEGQEEDEDTLELPDFGDFGGIVEMTLPEATRKAETSAPPVVESRSKVESSRDLKSSALREPSMPGSLQKAAQKVQTGFKGVFSRKQVKEKEATPISKGNPGAQIQEQVGLRKWQTAKPSSLGEEVNNGIQSTPQALGQSPKPQNDSDIKSLGKDYERILTPISEDQRQTLRSRTEAIFKQNSKPIRDQLPEEIFDKTSNDRSKALEEHVRATIENGGLKDCLINLGFTAREAHEIDRMQNRTTQSRGKEISIKEFMTREICYCMMPIIQGSNQ